MEKEQIFQRNAGLFIFFLSGICTINSGVVVSILQEIYGFAHDMTGTLLPLMSIGNLLAGFALGMLLAETGTKKTVVLLTASYGAGYMIMGFSGWMLIPMLGSFMIGVAKGSTINTCTILVADSSGNRTKGMNVVHGCCALDALLCPLFIAAVMKAGSTVPMLALTVYGFPLWLTFCVTLAEIKAVKKDWSIDKSFLESGEFQMFTGLLFYQNTTETSVTGQMVTYFKGSGIISESPSPYIVTVMWGATLIARLSIAFVVPIKDSHSAVIKMGTGCIISYMGLVMVSTQTTVILLLFAFALAIAGMSPTAITSVDRMTSAASTGIMLPAASSGAIIMPWIIDIVSEYAGTEIGMAPNIIPCAGILLFSAAVGQLKEQGL